MMKRGYVASLLTLSIAAFAACGSDEPTLTRKPVAEDGGTGTLLPNGIPFEPVTADVYVQKVKNLLTGLAATDAEVASVKADPNALKGLIDAWMTYPSFKVRITDFFRNAFQQNQVNIDTLMENTLVRGDLSDRAKAQLARNMMDSFALTAWQIMYDGQPFNSTLTTRKYMMTTAMAAYVAYSDEYIAKDTSNVYLRMAKATRNPLTQFQVNVGTGSYAYDAATKSITFGLPSDKRPANETCQNSMVVSSGTGNEDFYRGIFSNIFGRGNYNPCNVDNGGGWDSTGVYLTDADYNDWHYVTLDGSAQGDDATTPAFYDLEGIRKAKSIKVHADRIGFFGTPAFAANWATNNTNIMRVTANQALIVAAGQSIQGEDVLVTFPVDATDASHASNPACTGCHNQLDPYKQFFRNSYSIYYSEQQDSAQKNAASGFAIAPLNQKGKGVADLANIFAGNPRFPVAWVAKLHFWANSTPAIETDPEVLRIAQAFSSSSFDFKTLVRELFSSPLITWAAETETTKTNGVINSIARRDQFCASLSNRLQLNDVCGQLTITPSNAQRTIATRALMLPNDTYFRSYALPSLPTNPDLFFRQSTEAICALVGDQVVSTADGAKYSPNHPDEAIEDFVTNVMGVPPGDPRYAQAKAILSDNFTEASTVGRVDKLTAMKATFQLACLSPSSVMIGL